jgi:PAP2 superfamily
MNRKILAATCVTSVALIAFSVVSARASGPGDRFNARGAALGRRVDRAQSVAAPPSPTGTVATRWIDVVLAELQAHASSPPVAARLIGYVAIAERLAAADDASSYEKVRTLFPTLSAPEFAAGLDRSSLLAATLHLFVPAIFASSHPDTHRWADAASDAEFARTLDATTPAVTQAARLISDSVVGMAASDGFAKRREDLHELLTGPGHWTATKSGLALEPGWPKVRPLLSDAQVRCSLRPPIAFDPSPGSAFMEQVSETKAARDGTSPAEVAVVNHWADTPGLSVGPPGHWFAIGNDVARTMTFESAVEMHFELGVGLAQAMWATWQEKYRWQVVRPETIIRRSMDHLWEPLIVTPPFPEYPSGHSALAGVASVVIGARFDGAIVDTTNVARGLPALRFDNIKSAARSASRSRVLGGIHLPMSTDNGLQFGTCIGSAVRSAIAVTVPAENPNAASLNAKHPHQPDGES